MCDLGREQADDCHPSHALEPPALHTSCFLSVYSLVSVCVCAQGWSRCSAGHDTASATHACSAIHDTASMRVLHAHVHVCTHTHTHTHTPALAKADSIEEATHVAHRVEDPEQVATHNVEGRHGIAYILCAYRRRELVVLGRTHVICRQRRPEDEPVPPTPLRRSLPCAKGDAASDRVEARRGGVVWCGAGWGVLHGERRSGKKRLSGPAHLSERHLGLKVSGLGFRAWGVGTTGRGGAGRSGRVAPRTLGRGV